MRLSSSHESALSIFPESPHIFHRPDVAIIIHVHDCPRRAIVEPYKLEPITIPLTLEDLDEARQRWIEIRRLPDRSLVTVIEIISSTNMIGSGRIEYVEKRIQLIRQPVNLVEIDLFARRPPKPDGPHVTSGGLFRLHDHVIHPACFNVFTSPSVSSRL